jgi:hypothetical protein
VRRVQRCALDVVVDVRVEKPRLQAEASAADIRPELDAAQALRVQVDITDIQLAVREPCRRLQGQPEIALLVAWRALLLRRAGVEQGRIGKPVVELQDQVQGSVFLTAIRGVEGITQRLRRRHHHGRRAVHFIRIGRHAVEPQPELSLQPVTQILIALEEKPEHIALRIVEVDDEKHRVVRVVDVRVVYRAETVDTGAPDARRIGQCGLELEAGVFTAGNVLAPAPR